RNGVRPNGRLAARGPLLLLPSKRGRATDRVVPVGARAVRAGQTDRTTDLARHRSLLVSLVPRHGRGHVLGPRGRPSVAPAFCCGQGRPRRASRDRPTVSTTSRGAHGRRRLAAHRVPYLRGGGLSRGHLLSPGGRARSSRIPSRAEGSLPALPRGARTDPRERPGDPGRPETDARIAFARRPPARHVCRERSRGGPLELRPGERGLWNGAEVPPSDRRDVPALGRILERDRVKF